MSTTVDLTKDDAAQPVSVPTTTHISASQAAEIDVKLMGPEYGFTLEQLMELAGLSVAAATQRVFPVTPDTHQRILVLCGPGNNGGDGLVAARHLAHFGYESVFVCYPKRSAREPIYGKLVKQLETLEGVHFLNDAEEAEFVLDFETASIDVVIDAMFGFSFHGAPRSPFDALLHLLKHENNPPPIVSVDVPSGWDVDTGDVSGKGLRPDVLVSLTAPKLCAKTFTGKHHFVGGRFLPPKLAKEYGLLLPKFEGADQMALVEG